MAGFDADRSRTTRIMAEVLTELARVRGELDADVFLAGVTVVVKLEPNGQPRDVMVLRESHRDPRRFPSGPPDAEKCLLARTTPL